MTEILLFHHYPTIPTYRSQQLYWLHNPCCQLVWSQCQYANMQNRAQQHVCHKFFFPYFLKYHNELYYIMRC